MLWSLNIHLSSMACSLRVFRDLNVNLPPATSSALIASPLHSYGRGCREDAVRQYLIEKFTHSPSGLLTDKPPLSQHATGARYFAVFLGTF